MNKRLAFASLVAQAVFYHGCQWRSGSRSSNLREQPVEFLELTIQVTMRFAIRN
jgi:hypothetical protein